MEPIQLNGELTIYQVAEIKPLLQSALSKIANDGGIALDLTGISECDGAGLQLLLAFSHVAASSGHQISLLHVPAAITNMLSEYGVASRFALG